MTSVRRMDSATAHAVLEALEDSDEEMDAYDVQVAAELPKEIEADIANHAKPAHIEEKIGVFNKTTEVDPVAGSYNIFHSSVFSSLSFRSEIYCLCPVNYITGLQY